MTHEARVAFTRLLAASGEVDVLEAALWIAAEHNHDLNLVDCRRRFETLATAAQAKLGRLQYSELNERVRTLTLFFAEDLRFRGNIRDYYDPRNSFLPDVLERRVGIPISLAIVYIHLAKACGLNASGVSFPGHFLVRVDGDDEFFLIDPFHGRSLGVDGARDLFQSYAGERAKFSEQLLEPAASRKILRRLLSNLKHVFIARNDFAAALDCVDRILLVEPTAIEEVRDRGLIYARLELFRYAKNDLNAYLATAPEAEMAPAIRQILAEIEGKDTLIN